jgi:thymidylate synthase (FAD)
MTLLSATSTISESSISTESQQDENRTQPTASLGEFSPKNGESFVRYVDHMGNDSAIVQAARVSYGAGTKTVREDEGLIRFLMRHDHTTPFEMVEIKMHCKAPIFVIRQMFRHRTASINEQSGRYSEVMEDFYVPPTDRMRRQGKKNKQQSADECIDEIEFALSTIEDSMGASFDAYHKLLKTGLARETARIVLPLSTMSEFYWKNDLHNILRFLKLRLAPNAQQEIRDLAIQMAHIVKEIVPVTWKAWCELEYASVKASVIDLQMEECYEVLKSEAHKKWEFLIENGLL